MNSKLFPYLASFKQSATSPSTLEYKVGEIFSEVKNRIQSGYNLREILDLVDGLKFQTAEELHEMSFLYENKIKNMGNAGRNGGEYYTPRPLIKAIIEVVGPKVGQTIYDGATGSAGFLCEAFAYLLKSKKLTSEDIETLQTKTFFGKEKKSLAYVIGIMNMILHGIDAPNITHTNTLGENISDLQDKDRYDVVLANPPFGGKERKEVQQNFPYKTGETAYLFLQHFMKVLRAGGSAGIVIKNSFLSNTDNAAVAIRRELLENFNLHTILDCPAGTFQGAGVKTVVLFFKKGEPTSKIWYYQLDPKRSLGKTNPLNDNDMVEFITLSKLRADSELSWSINSADIGTKTFDLTPRNPNRDNPVAHRTPEDVLDEIYDIDGETTRIAASTSVTIRKILSSVGGVDGIECTIGDICEIDWGNTNLTKKSYVDNGKYAAVSAAGIDGRIDHYEHRAYTPVLSAIGANCGRMFLPTEDFTAIKNTITLTPNPGKVTSAYLFRLLQAIDLPKRGTGQPFISKGDIQKFKVRILPLELQDEAIDSVDKALDEIESLAVAHDAKMSLINELRNSILSKAFGASA